MFNFISRPLFNETAMLSCSVVHVGYAWLSIFLNTCAPEYWFPISDRHTPSPVGAESQRKKAQLSKQTLNVVLKLLKEAVPYIKDY